MEQRGLPIGQQVREARQSRGLSQQTLAERAGTTQPMIARMESGRVVPTIPTLERLADALGVELIVQLRPPSLEKLRAEVAEDHESLLHALDRRAPQLLGRASGDPDLDRFVRPHIEALLELRFDRHPWARLLVAHIAHEWSSHRPVAQAMVRDCWRSFRRTRDVTGQSYTAYVRGGFALGLGDLEEARRWWDLARGLLPGNSPTEPVDELSLSHTALASYMRGDLEDCATTAQQAVVLAQLRANRVVEGLSLVYLAFVELNRGGFDRAEDLLRRAESAFSLLPRPEDREPASLIPTCRGTLYVLRGDLARAAVAFRQAEEESGSWFRAIAHAARAEMIAPYQPDDAEAIARAVLEFSSSTGDLWWRTWAERALGIAAGARGELAVSRTILTTIQDINPLERGRTLLALGATLGQLGDRRGAAGALKEAAEIFEARGARYWQVRALVQLAELQPATFPLSRARALAGTDRAYARLFGPAEEDRLEIHLAQPRAVLVGGTPASFSSRRAADLLYALAEHGPMCCNDLARTLWPADQPDACTARLRTAVWDARRGLGAQAWRLQRKGQTMLLEGAELPG